MVNMFITADWAKWYLRSDRFIIFFTFLWNINKQSNKNLIIIKLIFI